MTGPSSISRPTTSPVTSTGTTSSTSADTKTSTTATAHAGPKADAALDGLASKNESGGAKRASFATSKPADGTSGTSASQSSRLGRLGQVASEAFKDTTGVASAVENAFSGLMQLEQARANALAELMKNGAKNIEEASKG
ncbi:hypothetical protein AAHK20_29870 [Trinickia sp. YCB016]